MRISGGLVFHPEEGFAARDLYTDGPLLAETGGGEVLDASSCYVIPGLVDIHLHGCVGEDFSDASPEGLQVMADYELSQGVTCFCPAAMTLPEAQLAAACRNAAAHREKNAGGAEVAGVHLEGPFLSAARKGAQNGAFLRAPDIPMLKRLQAAAQGGVRLVTIAPELPGAMEFIRAAAGMGVAVSLGHTAADYDTAKAAFAAGASHVTHTFNAMTPFAHRAPGVVGAAADCGHVMCELICDGVHVHPAMVRAMFRLMGRDRMILVSDSMRAAGMPDGSYTLGGQAVTVRSGLARLEDGTIAGSVTHLMDCLRRAVSFGVPLADAVRACTCSPARAIGIGHRAGTLDAGKEASLILLDRRDLSVRGILFRGRPVAPFASCADAERPC